jgi:hypothetical protein
LVSLFFKTYMKKRNIIFPLLLLIVVYVLHACRCQDCNEPSIPIITLTGNEDTNLVFKDIWVEPGYVALDDLDGDITRQVIISGNVNNVSAGHYILTYNVRNASGDAASPAFRKVTVDAAPYLAIKYNVVGTTNNGTTTYIDSVIVSAISKNRIIFGRFNDNINCQVFANLSDTIIEIPYQLVMIGSTNTIEHAFQGSGTFTTTNKMNIIYSDSSSLGVFSGLTATYTKY